MGNHKAQGQPRSPGMILKIHVTISGNHEAQGATTKPRSDLKAPCVVNLGNLEAQGRPRSPGVISKLHVLQIWATTKPRGDHEAPEWSRSSMCFKFGKIGQPQSPWVTTKPWSHLVCILVSIQADCRSCPQFRRRMSTDETNWISVTNIFFQGGFKEVSS